MAGTQPFEETPWEGSGPRFGNAYEQASSSSTHPSGSVGFARMPSPSDYQSSHGWSESNKTEYTIPAEPQNAWADHGSVTAMSQNATHAKNNDDAASKIEVSPMPSPPPPAGGKPRPSQAEIEAALPPVWGTSTHPSKLRLLLRGLQLVAAVGHLGFAAGASPYSGVDVPLSSSACFYFLFAVAILAILWSLFHVALYGYRRIKHGNKMNRLIMSGIDLLLAILWGVGVIVEIAKYRCSPGDFNHWCDFYNVSIFWGMLSFVLFVIAVGWDVMGVCTSRRK